MYYVYVLRSLKNGRLYVGCTNNLERRIQEHNTGQSKYTSLTKPFKIIHQEEFNDLSSARKREKMLKGGQGREWIKNNFG